MPNRSLTPSPPVAALVHDDAKALPRDWLMTAMMSTMWGIWAQQKKPNSPEEFITACINGVVVFVEGPKNHEQHGDVQIFHFGIRELDVMTSAFLSLPLADEGDDIVQPAMFMVGSTDFCAAVVRYVSIDRRGQMNTWGTDFVEHLSTVTPGCVLWSLDDENGDADFTKANIAEVFIEAKNALAA